MAYECPGHWRHMASRADLKAAAYLQSWPQTALSAIRLDIAKKRGWDPQTNTHFPQPARSAHRCVFCLFSATEAATARRRILDPQSWEFRALPTSHTDRGPGEWKSIGLLALRGMTSMVPNAELKHHIDTALGIAECPYKEKTNGCDP